jgi:lipoprotein-anchoring transpeptidase ErfK/SrfK
MIERGLEDATWRMPPGGCHLEDAMGRLAGVAGFAVVMVLLSSAGNARADVVVRIDKSSQWMSVIVNGEHRYTWAVSTGIYGTPSGTFRPQSLARYHRSTLYNNAPMPYSIFYDGNFAVHGTTHVSQLGGPASRGCIRLHPSNAAVLFSLVQQQGLGNTRISIH